MRLLLCGNTCMAACVSKHDEGGRCVFGREGVVCVGGIEERGSGQYSMYTVCLPVYYLDYLLLKRWKLVHFSWYVSVCVCVCVCLGVCGCVCWVFLAHRLDTCTVHSINSRYVIL